MNPRTGLTSPQFHVKYDDSFETVQGQPDITHGTWKHRRGFTKAPSGHHIDFKSIHSPRMENNNNDTLQVLQQPNKGATNVNQQEQHEDFILPDQNEDNNNFEPIEPLPEQVPPHQPNLHRSTQIRQPTQ